MSSSKGSARQAIAGCLASVLLMPGCALNEWNEDAETMRISPAATSTLRGAVSGIGASSINGAQITWIAAVQEGAPGVRINYAPDGSGAGREAFMAGGADFAGSDRALTPKENTAGAFGGCAAGSTAYDLPVFISPIAVVFRLDGVASLNLTPETLAAIFAGEITTWNDARIAATNPKTRLPDQPITAVHRSDESGTTQNFTDYLHQAAPSTWPDQASGRWPHETGEAAKGTSGVVATVANGTGTIGYADLSQIGSLPSARIGRAGAFRGPTSQDAAAAVHSSPVERGRATHDLALALDREADGYPIVLVTYVIACARYRDAAKAGLVRHYLGHVVSERGQSEAAASAGAAPLPSTLRAKVAAAVGAIR